MFTWFIEQETSTAVRRALKELIARGQFLLTALALGILVFFAETLLPEQYSIGILYLPIALVSLQAKRHREAIIFASAATIFSLVSWFFSPLGLHDNLSADAVNRGLTIAVLWLTVAVAPPPIQAPAGDMASQDHQARLDGEGEQPGPTPAWKNSRESPDAALPDATQHHSTKDPARQTDACVRALLETAPEAIVSTDEFGHILSFSRSAEELFGYTAEEIVGRDIRVLTSAPLFGKRGWPLEKTLSHTAGVAAGLRRNGSAFPMEVSLREALVGGKRFVTGIFRDTTCLQRVERELRHNHKLDAVGQLTGGIAHDFNNLLTVAIGNIEMLEASKALRARDRILLSATRDAVHQGAQLIQHLLAFGCRQPCVFLPHADSSSSLPSKSRGGSANTPGSRAEKILVVEDDANIRRITIARMQALGYTVFEAATASEALTLLQQVPQIDLLFTDIVMPGEFNGTDLARIIRGNYPDTQILLTSGHADPETLERNRAVGARCLRKPYTASELARELRDALSVS